MMKWKILSYLLTIQRWLHSLLQLPSLRLPSCSAQHKKAREGGGGEGLGVAFRRAWSVFVTADTHSREITATVLRYCTNGIGSRILILFQPGDRGLDCFLLPSIKCSCFTSSRIVLFEFMLTFVILLTLVMPKQCMASSKSSNLCRCLNSDEARNLSSSGNAHVHCWCLLCKGKAV